MKNKILQKRSADLINGKPKLLSIVKNKTLSKI